MEKQRKGLSLGTIISLGIGVGLGCIIFKLTKQNQKLQGEIEALKYSEQLLTRHVWKSGKLVEKIKGARRG